MTRLAATDMAPRYLTASDVAAYMQISRNMVDNLVKAGRIPPPIELTGRLKRWDREALDAALAGKPVPSRMSASDIIRGLADDIAGEASQGRAARHKAAQGR